MCLNLQRAIPWETDIRLTVRFQQRIPVISGEWAVSLDAIRSFPPTLKCFNNYKGN
jgi:hypothetical protein